MNKYRVTYIESILREVVIHAKTTEDAENMAHQQYLEAEHHHAVDVWNDDWQVNDCKPSSWPNLYCFECGAIRT